jgi:hypothetical protein
MGCEAPPNSLGRPLMSTPYEDRDEKEIDKANERATARLLALLQEHHRPEEVRNHDVQR